VALVFLETVVVSARKSTKRTKKTKLLAMGQKTKELLGEKQPDAERPASGGGELDLRSKYDLRFKQGNKHKSGKDSWALCRTKD